MQACVLHSFEKTSIANDDRLFGGRWGAKINYESHDTSIPGRTVTYSFLEITDFFGHQEKRKFMPNENQRHLDDCILLNKRFGIIEPRDTPHIFNAFRCGELDWNNSKINLGQSIFVVPGEEVAWVLVDRGGPRANGDICFAFVVEDTPFNKFHHCRLDVTELKIIQNENTFTLATDDFSHLDLNGEIISGLAKSLVEIKRFNVRTRKMMNSIVIHGLPATIQFADKSCGPWTDNYLFVWSLDGGNPLRSIGQTTLYYIQLDSGVAVSTNRTFDGCISGMVIGPGDRHLYISTIKYLRETPRLKVGNEVLTVARHPIELYRYFRIPFNKPESLFFLAAAALPRPLSPLAEHIIRNYHETVPLNVFK